jgi:2-hydroxymuconate-semialdehyde hydrolase
LYCCRYDAEDSTVKTQAVTLESGDFIEAGTYKTHYHEAGNGETLVFVHGSGPGVTAWANWRLALPVFAERYHVLAPDILGFGYSDRPDGVRYGKDVWVSHLAAFLAAKHVKRCHIVGNSMGGALAVALAARRPDLIDRMVLLGSTGVPFPITQGLDAVWGYEPSRESMRELIAGYFAFDRSIVTDDLVELRYAASMQPGFQESYGRMFPAPRQNGVNDLATPIEEIRRIAAPTLLIHGREDQVIPLAVSYELFDLIPNAQLHVFGRCGHWTQIERRHEFNAVVSTFLNEGSR